MPIVEYKCKLCNTSSGSYKEARACEETHLKVKRARAIRFIRGPYPLLIEAEFPDGTKLTYIQEDDYWRK
jgi:hypothetical protein